MTQPTISAERIEEMLAGLEGPVGAVVIRGDDLADVRTAMTLALSALRAQAQGSEAVAVIRFNHGPGTENDMPTVVSCDWRPNGDYALYASPPVQAQPQGCATEGCENQCVTNYEAGGVGSYYCEWCLRKVKALATPPAPVDGGVTDAQYDLASAAKFLLWQFDRQGPLTESTEAWEQLRAALATPPAPVDGGATDALSKLVDAVSNMRVPQNIAEAGIQVMLTLGPALENARAALTAAQAAVAQDETP